VGDAVFGPGEGRAQVEDGFATLVGDDVTGREGAPVADSVDDEADGDIVGAALEEVGVEGVDVAGAGLEGEAGGHDRLRCDVAAEEAAGAGAGLAEEEVPVEPFELEVLEEQVEGAATGHGRYSSGTGGLARGRAAMAMRTMRLSSPAMRFSWRTPQDLQR
jgi:hypothetical protein